MDIPLKQDNTPTREGYYLFRGAFSGDISILYVRFYPTYSNYGIQIDSYLGVANMGGRHINNFTGFFSDRLNFV